MPILIMFLTALFIFPAWAAAIPQSSKFDSRMQHIAYNDQNTTVINAQSGYVSTLVFAEDETVIGTEVGFIKGWSITHEANRVYIRPAPIVQSVIDEDGSTLQEAFVPDAVDWNTNLFVTTSAHFYSLELKILETRAQGNLAFVVTWHYPDVINKAANDNVKAHQQAQVIKLEKQRISQAFDAAHTPRNWDYAQRVKPGSETIAPDFAYDDGRFTYLGFSPIKKIPSPFLLVNGKEQTSLPTFTEKGNYRVMVIPSLSRQLVLRYGDAVVGIVNQGFGKVTVRNGSTVSPAVILEEKT